MPALGRTRSLRVGRARECPCGKESEREEGRPAVSLPTPAEIKTFLDDYVVGKGLDGLFYVLGEEERKIRREPAARVTDLLKDVFGR